MRRKSSIDGGIANCFSGSYNIVDASGQIIVPPGNYDGGPVCVEASSSTGILVSGQNVDVPACSSSAIEPPGNAPSGQQHFIVNCRTLNAGTFSLLAFSSVSTGGIGTGPLSNAQLTAYGLTYPNQGALAVENFPTYSCATDGTISEIGPANGPLTVQSRAVKT